MPKKSLQERILDYFKKRPNTWINGGDIERLALNAGYKASNASRRCRELREQGYLIDEERKNPDTGVRSVWYQINPKRLRVTEYRVPDTGKVIVQYNLV